MALKTLYVTFVPLKLSWGANVPDGAVWMP